MSAPIRSTVYEAEARDMSDDELATALDSHFASNYSTTNYAGLALVREASTRLRAVQTQLDAANLTLASVRSLVCL